jgi:hypothetical protein
MTFGRNNRPLMVEDAPATSRLSPNGGTAGNAVPLVERVREKVSILAEAA